MTENHTNSSFTMKTRPIRCNNAYEVNKNGKQPITSFSGTNRPKMVILRPINDKERKTPDCVVYDENTLSTVLERL